VYQRRSLLDGLVMYLSCDTAKFHDNESTHILHNFWTSTHRGEASPFPPLAAPLGIAERVRRVCGVVWDRCRQFRCRCSRVDRCTRSHRQCWCTSLAHCTTPRRPPHTHPRLYTHTHTFNGPFSGLPGAVASPLWVYGKIGRQLIC